MTGTPRFRTWHTILLALCVGCMAAASCSDDKDTDPTRSAVAVTATATDVGIIAATMQGWVNVDKLPSDTLAYEAGIEYALTPDFGRAIEWQSVGTDGRRLSRTINCVPNTTYYYRTFVRAGGVTYHGETLSFHTDAMAAIAQTGGVASTFYTRAAVWVDVQEDLLDAAFTAGTYGKLTNREIYHDVAVLYSTDREALAAVGAELPEGVGCISFRDQAKNFSTTDTGRRSGLKPS
ncbi:MAG: hypothetical protein ILA34_04225 [Bacteroidaceae bacterium]|nr:hypothetical protein [Bacteroidaceae bacterium]